MHGDGEPGWRSATPDEHDVIDEDRGKAYLARRQGSQGGGWYSFDHSGVHFIGSSTCSTRPAASAISAPSNSPGSTTI
jgi:hypothetical protein